MAGSTSTRAAEPRRTAKATKKKKAAAAPKRAKAGKDGRVERFRRRYAVPYDIDGPRVRLGFAWFLVAAVGVAGGPLPTAIVYGAAAVIAAAQMVRVWRRSRVRPATPAALGMAGGAALGACFGAGGAGLAVLAGTGAAVAFAFADARSQDPVVSDAGWTIQCALPVGLAAASMVLLTRLDQGSAVALLLVVSAYETGDYIVGSGARNALEGPIAGIAAVTVATFIVSSFGISVFDVGEAWLFGALVALLAPLGQLFASALLPAADAPASGLRRLDSLLLAGPIWYLGVAAVS